MILKIILLIIFFQLGLERFREGMDLNYFDIEPPPLEVECEYKINRKLPEFNQEINKNGYIYNNYRNIATYANSPC